jgi:hypothetical protein
MNQMIGLVDDPSDYSAEWYHELHPDKKLVTPKQYWQLDTDSVATSS